MKLFTCIVCFFFHTLLIDCVLNVQTFMVENIYEEMFTPGV